MSAATQTGRPARKLPPYAPGAAFPVPMTHRQLQQNIADLCGLFGLLEYHTFDSRKSPRGFPDHVITGTRTIYREVKVPPDKLTARQGDWRDALVAAGDDWGVWTPEDWHSGRIMNELRALRSGTR
jgi:hypothetical protein